MAIAPVDVEIGSDAPRGGGGKTVLPFVLPKSEHRCAIPRVHVPHDFVDYRRCHHRGRQVITEMNRSVHETENDGVAPII